MKNHFFGHHRRWLLASLYLIIKSKGAFNGKPFDVMMYFIWLFVEIFAAKKGTNILNTVKISCGLVRMCLCVFKYASQYTHTKVPMNQIQILVWFVMKKNPRCTFFVISLNEIKEIFALSSLVVPHFFSSFNERIWRNFLALLSKDWAGQKIFILKKAKRKRCKNYNSLSIIKCAYIKLVVLMFCINHIEVFRM